MGKDASPPETRRLGPRRCPGAMLGCKQAPVEVRVITFQANHSAFNGYHRTPSDYSLVQAKCCGSFWRTKAAYVETVFCDIQKGHEYAPDTDRPRRPR